MEWLKDGGEILRNFAEISDVGRAIVVLGGLEQAGHHCRELQEGEEVAAPEGGAPIFIDSITDTIIKVTFGLEGSIKDASAIFTPRNTEVGKVQMHVKRKGT